MQEKKFKQFEQNLNTVLDSLKFYTPVMIALIVVFGMEYLKTGYALVFFHHCIAPILDRFMPYDDVNYNKDDEKQKKYSIFYSIPLYVAIFVDVLLMIYTLYKICFTPLSVFQAFFLAFSASLSLGSTINVSHELIHRLSPLEQSAGIFNLMRMMYAHYQIAHIMSHHKYVGTKKDPVVAQKNETIFAYMFRQIQQTYIKAWSCENERVVKFHKATNPYLSIYNRMIYYSIAQLFVPTVVYKICGLYGLGFYLLMVLISVAESLVIEYIEHYGLTQYQDIDIQYDSSWNAPHKFSNMLSFRFERHSDHHVNAHKEYQVTQFNYEWPTLPESYASCMHIALQPSEWMKVMNTRLDAVINKKQLSQQQLIEEREIINKVLIKTFSIHTALFVVSFFVK
ncbi:hypothetical protein ABPG74_015539 [Tetrahymena malaccensis]